MACHSTYVAVGSSWDKGSVGGGSVSANSGLGYQLEVGSKVKEKGLLAFRSSIIGYSSAQDGDPFFNFTLEYAHISTLSKNPNQLSLFYGGGIGINRIVGSTFPVVPLRVGLFYDIPILKKRAIRFAIIERPQFYYQNELSTFPRRDGFEFNNDLSFMIGFRF